MHTINLHHLYAFNAVAKAGGIRRSAEALYRASSSVTRSVAMLEEELDAELFVRKGRGMSLTAAGEVVRMRAKIIESELRDVRAEAMRLSAHDGNLVGNMEVLFNERRLQAATTLADVHHMPTVARQMGISQSAVSQAIAKLEDGLGQPLFRRAANGMVPSDIGCKWIMRFNRALVELNHIASDLAAHKGVLEGAVSIGALPLTRSSILPTAIASLLKDHPRLRLRSFEGSYEELTKGLLSGRIDLIVGALCAPVGQGLVASPLLQTRTAVVARAGHPLASKAGLCIADLENYPWVLSRAGTPLRMSLERFYRIRGNEPPQPTAETDDLELVRGLLVSSDMLTVLSSHQLRVGLDSSQLAVLPLPMPGSECQIGVTMRKDACLSPSANALLSELRKIAEKWQE